jgi:hypothetical protein
MGPIVGSLGFILGVIVKLLRFKLWAVPNKPLLREQPTRRAGFFIAGLGFPRLIQPGG